MAADDVDMRDYDMLCWNAPRSLAGVGGQACLVWDRSVRSGRVRASLDGRSLAPTWDRANGWISSMCCMSERVSLMRGSLPVSGVRVD